MWATENRVRYDVSVSRSAWLTTVAADTDDLSCRMRIWSMDIDTDNIDEAVLALLYLTLHDGVRAWKGHDWDALDRLYRKGMIDNPVGKASKDIGDLERRSHPNQPPGSLPSISSRRCSSGLRHRADRLGGDAGIERGRVQLGMPEQNLDDANIDILLEQVSGKAGDATYAD